MPHTSFWQDSRRRAALTELASTFGLSNRERAYLREAIREEEHVAPPASDELRTKLDHLARAVRLYFERGCVRDDPSHADFWRVLRDEERRGRIRRARPRPRHLAHHPRA